MSYSESESILSGKQVLLTVDTETERRRKIEHKEEAIQLIEFKSSNFKVNPEAYELINSIEEDIIVVAVVGKARTGKSYLMNLLLDNVGKSKGFDVDSKLSSCTKGIWMWGNTRNSLHGSGTKIIFIDSEGTSATDRGTKTYDSRIFALIVLISSLFIYNSTSNIDENGISELSLAAHLSKSITTNSGIDKDSLLTELSPKFIWVLRDFTLLKTHPETGQEISSKEYLEICLRKKTSKKANDSNLIRDNIIKYFPDRDCFTLARPVENESDLQQLNKIPFDKLKSNFKIEFKQLKDKIFKESTPKKFQGKRLNGPTLAQLIIEFVSAINSGEIPNINNSWDSVVHKDIANYYYKAYDHFRNKTSNLRNIYEQSELIKSIGDFKYESLMIFYKLLRLNPDTFSDKNYMNKFNESKLQLYEKFKETENKIEKTNIDKSTDQCKILVKDEFKYIMKKLNDEYYYNFRLVDELNEEYKTCLDNYLLSDKSMGINKLGCLIDYLIQIEPIILQSLNKSMSKECNKVMLTGDKNYKENIFIIEELDNTYKNMLSINDTSYGRITNFERDIARCDKDLENLKERLKNKEEEMEAVKEIEKQNITYKNNGKIGKMEDYEADDPKGNQKAKKNKNCGCQCTIY